MDVGRSPSGRMNDLWVFNCETNAWTCLEPNNARGGPLVRSGCVLVHDGANHLYVGFGYDTLPNAHNDMYRYDLYERKWTHLEPAGTLRPPPRINFRGWFYGDAVWIFGGSPDGSACFGDLWKYDVITNMWSQPATIGESPAPCQWSAIELWKGSKVIFFGGHFASGLPARVFHMFDCETLEWKSLLTDEDPVIEDPRNKRVKKAPRKEEDAAGEDADVAAGGDGGAAVAEVEGGLEEDEEEEEEGMDEVYTTWDHLMCSSPASAIMDDSLILWGGWDGRMHRCTMWSVDLKTGIWHLVRPDDPRQSSAQDQLKVRPQPKGSATAIVWKSSLFLFGGWNGWTQTNNMHAVSFEFPSLQRLCLEVISKHRDTLGTTLVDLSLFDACLQNPFSHESHCT